MATRDRPTHRPDPVPDRARNKGVPTIVRSPICVLLIAWAQLLCSGAALAQTPEAVQAPPLAQLESGIEVRVEGARLSVSGPDGPLFQASLQVESPVTNQVRDAAPQVRAFAWNYPHLQDIVFLDLTEPSAGPERPGLVVESAAGFELRTRPFSPHDGMGGDARRTVDFWRQRRDTANGHEYLAVVRLDGARSRAIEDSRIVFESDPADRLLVRWPLAIVRADTERGLRARIEQAILAFDGAGTREDPARWWQVPALCGMCQQQQVTEVELDLQDRGSSLLLRVTTRVSYPDHALATPEGMRIEGLPLAPWFTGEQDDEAWFVIPLDAALAESLFSVALSGDAQVQARLGTGEYRDVATVRVKLDPEFQERLYSRGDAPREEPDWPNHLASGLVSSWPNPFRDSTSIEITVPGTIAEAFDLEADLLARVDPAAEPPFGTNPSVRVKVYNVSGQLVAVLDEGPRIPGRFTVNWDGQNLQSRPVVSGAYYIHVEMDEWSVTRRVLLLRN